MFRPGDRILRKGNVTGSLTVVEVLPDGQLRCKVASGRIRTITRPEDYRRVGERGSAK